MCFLKKKNFEYRFSCLHFFLGFECRVAVVFPFLSLSIYFQFFVKFYFLFLWTLILKVYKTHTKYNNNNNNIGVYDRSDFWTRQNDHAIIEMYAVLTVYFCLYLFLLFYWAIYGFFKAISLQRLLLLLSDSFLWFRRANDIFLENTFVKWWW